MKYVSIDIETTGLDTQNDEILSIGAVIEDTDKLLPIEQLPKLHMVIAHERIKAGSMFALNMNKKLIEWIARYNNARTGEERKQVKQEANAVFIEEDEVVETFINFLWRNGITPEKAGDSMEEKLRKNQEFKYSLRGDLISQYGKTYFNVAGKNFNGFDRLFLERLPKWNMAIGRRIRVLDPAMYYIDWLHDSSLPGLSKCKERAGLTDSTVTHNAVEDAIDVILVLRKQYENLKSPESLLQKVEKADIVFIDKNSTIKDRFKTPTNINFSFNDLVKYEVDKENKENKILILKLKK